MDLELNADQRAVRDAIERIVSRHTALAVDRAEPREWVYGDAMERELQQGGFFSLALTEGFGALEAALLVYEAARSPLVIETAGSALVGAVLLGEELPRPVALARAEDLTRGVRFLDRAQSLIVDCGDDVVVIEPQRCGARAAPSMFAYPLGKFDAPPKLDGRRLGRGAVAPLRRLWRLGLALEAAGAMQAAVDFTNAYVKDRKVFGKPVGAFQAVQHRLSVDAQKARGAYWLALRAAWSGDDADALTAALYAQQAIESVNYDTHQFNGALGMTLEHQLHSWTFRLRWLEGELGGARAQARALAEIVWGA